MVLEKEETRRTYDDIVGRRIDPALIEQVTPNQFRLSIFPFPAQGSRRVEFEYMQLLESRNGRLDYSFPLAPETDQPLQMELFVLRAQVRSQHAFEATTSGLPRLTEIDRPDAHRANIFFGDERVKPREDFTLTISQTDDRPKPTVLSFAPQPNDDLGLLRPMAAATARVDARRTPAAQPDLCHRYFVEHAARQTPSRQRRTHRSDRRAGCSGPVQHCRLHPPGRLLCCRPSARRSCQQEGGYGLHQPARRTRREQF